MQDPKVAKNRHLGTIAQLCQAISLQLRHVSTIGKNLLRSNISPTCPHNMVNFGPLAPEILSLVWGTPGTLNGFRVLASGHYRTTLSGCIFTIKAHIDNRKKNLLSSNISSTCPHNMVNLGLLAAEIVSLVWCTPGNFNGFRVLAALLHGTLVVGVSQTTALNRGRHLYSAGRPSHWALAHISSYNLTFLSKIV